MKFENEILKAQVAQELHIDAQIEGTDVHTFLKCFHENLHESYDRESFQKSWSADLAKKFPSGGWRTVNGAAVFINGGKVIAGLGGFNGAIDKFFEEKKGKESGEKKDKGDDQYKNELKNYQQATGDKKEKMKKMLESNANMPDGQLSEEQKKIKQKSINILKESGDLKSKQVEPKAEPSTDTKQFVNENVNDNVYAFFNTKTNEIVGRGLTSDMIDYHLYKKNKIKDEYLKVIKTPSDDEVRVTDSGSLVFKDGYEPQSPKEEKKEEVSNQSLTDHEQSMLSAYNKDKKDFISKQVESVERFGNKAKETLNKWIEDSKNPEYLSMLNEVKNAIEKKEGGGGKFLKEKRNIWIPNMTKGKLDKLLQKEKLSKNDIEDLKDFKSFLLTDKQSGEEKGFYQKLQVSQKGDAYVLKDKFLLTNIENKLNQSSNQPKEEEKKEKPVNETGKLPEFEKNTILDAFKRAYGLQDSLDLKGRSTKQDVVVALAQQTGLRNKFIEDNFEEIQKLPKQEWKKSESSTIGVESNLKKTFSKGFDITKNPNHGGLNIRGEAEGGYWINANQDKKGEFSVMIGQKSKDSGNAGTSMNTFYNKDMSASDLSKLDMSKIIAEDKKKGEEIRKQFEDKYANKNQ